MAMLGEAAQRQALPARGGFGGKKPKTNPFSRQNPWRGSEARPASGAKGVGLF